MKKSKYTESQIFQILKEAETGVPVTELCRQYAIGNTTFYKWRSKYGGLDVSNLKRMKVLEAENARLKKMYADERLISEVRREALEGKW